MGHFLRRICRAVFLSFRFDHYIGCLPFFEAHRDVEVQTVHHYSGVMAGLVQACPGHPRLFWLKARKKDVDAREDGVPAA
jgi:hypothetical protein